MPNIFPFFEELFVVLNFLKSPSVIWDRTPPLAHLTNNKQDNDMSFSFFNSGNLDFLLLLRPQSPFLRRSFFLPARFLSNRTSSAGSLLLFLQLRRPVLFPVAVDPPTFFSSYSLFPETSHLTALFPPFFPFCNPSP